MRSGNRIHRRLNIEELEPRIAPTTYHITDVNGLQAMQNDPAGTYILDNDINASVTSSWNAGAGFAPVGISSYSFGGSFDGQGHTISGLYINRPGQVDVGLFGNVWGGTISNISLAGETVTGFNCVGGLVGDMTLGTISNCHCSAAVTTIGVGTAGGGLGGYVNLTTVLNSDAAGPVNGCRNVGGLVGLVKSGKMSNCYATGAVTGAATVGAANVGGLVGSMDGTMSDCYATGDVSGLAYYVGGLAGAIGGTISNCHAAGKVSGLANSNSWFVGGLAGGAGSGTLSYCYATGVVFAPGNSEVVGGLLGSLDSCLVSNSFATGSVTGGIYAVGGFAGNISYGTASKCYSTGNVTCTSGNYFGGFAGLVDTGGTVSDCYEAGAMIGGGGSRVGGLVGMNHRTITNSYATGNVSGGSSLGGLLGANSGTVSNCFWDMQTTGQTSSAGGTAKTTAEMKQQGTFSGWDFASTWAIVENTTYPYLPWGTSPDITGLVLSASSDTGVSNSDGITNRDNSSPANRITLTVSGTTAGATVWVYYAGQTIGSATAGGTTTDVTTNGTVDLPDGADSISASQTVLGMSPSSNPASLSVTIDTAPPGAPNAPVLGPASDSGVSDTDNITNVTKPSLMLSGFGSTSSPLNGGCWRLYRGGTGGTLLGGSYGTATSYTEGAALGDGAYAYTLYTVDAAGNVSTVASQLNITIDTTTPGVPGMPDLADASDSGVSNSDNITNVTTPTLNLSGFGSDYYRLSRDGGAIGQAYGTGGSFTESPALAEGTYAYILVAVDAAGNVSAASSPLNVTIDTTVPADPSVAPGLLATSDSGISNADNITNDNTPAFGVTAGAPYYRLYANGAQVSGGYENGAQCTALLLGDGTYSFAVRNVDAAGNVSSGASPGLSVTIDATPPAAPNAPDLDASRDSGVSATDNITNNNVPLLNLGGFGSYYRLFRDGVQVSGDYSTAATYTEPATLGDGVYVYGLRAVDVAGNTGGAATLSVTIDTTPPPAPNAPDLIAASDSGASNTDNITNDSTPTFAVTVGAPYFRLYRDGAQISGDYVGSSQYTPASRPARTGCSGPPTTSRSHRRWRGRSPRWS